MRNLQADWDIWDEKWNGGSTVDLLSWLHDAAREAIDRAIKAEAENAKLREVLSKPNIETLASKVHDGWWEEKELQGFHAPLECPYRTPTNPHGKFEAVCDQCHTDMYPYNELPENIKDYDRVTVKAVLIALAELDEEGER